MCSLLFSRSVSSVKKEASSVANEREARTRAKAKKSMDDLLFKSPLAPARSYHSPRRSQFSPRAGFPLSPGGAGTVSWPRYCPTLCDPLSPMPPTPQYIHIDSDDDGEDGGSSNVGVPPPVSEEDSRPFLSRDKSLPASGTSGRRGHLLDKVLQVLKRTAENANKENHTASGAAGGDLSTVSPLASPVSEPTPMRRGRKPAEKPIKAEPRTAQLLAGTTEVGSSGQGPVKPPGFSIFGTRMETPSVAGGDHKEQQPVEAAAVPDSSAADEDDLVQRVRLALQQQNLQDNHQSRTPRPRTTGDVEIAGGATALKIRPQVMSASASNRATPSHSSKL